MKRIISMTLVFCLLLSLFLVGCGGNKEDSAANSSTTISENTKSADSSENDTGFKYLKKYDPKITLTINLAPDPGKSLDSDDPFGKFNAKAKWSEEELGIIWKPKWNVPNSEQQEKINLGIASNDLPDYLRWISKDQFFKMQKYGQLAPIGDLVEKYGSPLLKYLMFEEYNNAYGGNGFKSVTFDGKIYALPAIMDAISSSFDQAWIREDIIKELGFSAPENIEDLEKIFKAYKEKNPDGVIYTMTKDLGGIDAILTSFGAAKGKWIKNSAGEVVYSSIQPEVKQGLAKLNEWYKAGYLDKEFIAKDFNKATETFSKDGALVLGHGGYYNPYWPFPDMVKANPKIEFAPVGYMKGPDGKRLGQILNDPFYAHCAINAQTKNPEAMIYELNLTVDSYYRNHKDLREKLKGKYDFFFPETEYRKMTNPDAAKNGELPEYDYPEELLGPIDFFNRSIGPNHDGQVGFEPEFRAGFELDVFTRISDALDNNTFDQLDGVAKNHYDYRFNSMGLQKNCMDAMIKQMNQRQEYVDEGIITTNQFLGTPTPTMESKLVYLNKLELQMFSDIIVGNVPLDKFDEFVKQWKEQGGDQITKEVNEWVKNNQ